MTGKLPTTVDDLAAAASSGAELEEAMFFGEAEVEISPATPDYWPNTSAAARTNISAAGGNKPLRKCLFITIFTSK